MGRKRMIIRTVYTVTMVEKIYNYFGSEITDTRIELLSPDYGWVDENNIPHIEWGKETDTRDGDGFDKNYRPIQGREVFIIEDFILPRGTMICRYGFPTGMFIIPKGTEYRDLALPYVEKTIEYHEYKVTEALKLDCIVTMGRVAPMFASNGGAIQFLHRQTVILECEDGFLQEDYSWRQKDI